MPTMTDTRHYRTREFAEMTGVTVRTLHFYDRMGLLRPHRTRAGHRRYVPADVDALRLIRVLKFVGVSLKKIKAIARSEARLAEALEAQRGLLESRRNALDQAIGVLGEIERTVASRQPISGALLQRIAESMEPVSDANLRRRYKYQLAGKIARLKDNFSRVTRYAELCREIENAVNDDPASPRMQELAKRWMELGVHPTGFDPLLMTATRGMFREAFGNARELKASFPLITNPDVAQAVQRALAVRQLDARS
jgi:DNA-binding transcriptional MerR regulator